MEPQLPLGGHALELSLQLGQPGRAWLVHEHAVQQAGALVPLLELEFGRIPVMRVQRVARQRLIRALTCTYAGQRPFRSVEVVAHYGRLSGVPTSGTNVQVRSAVGRNIFD
jgi:hypothetical protein